MAVNVASEVTVGVLARLQVPRYLIRLHLTDEVGAYHLPVIYQVTVSYNSFVAAVVRLHLMAVAIPTNLSFIVAMMLRS
jgi:hypothetical protein